MSSFIFDTITNHPISHDTDEMLLNVQLQLVQIPEPKCNDFIISSFAKQLSCKKKCIEHINQNFMNASQPTRQLSSISPSIHRSLREVKVDVDVERDAKGTDNKKLQA